MAEEVRFRIDADDDTGPGVASAIAHLKALEQAEDRHQQLLKKQASERQTIANLEKAQWNDRMKQADALNRARERERAVSADLLKAERDLNQARKVAERNDNTAAITTVRGTKAIKERTRSVQELRQSMDRFKNGGAISRMTGTEREIKDVERGTTAIRRSTAAVKDSSRAWGDFDKLVGKIHRPIDFGAQGIKPRNLAIGGAVTGLLALGRPLESLLGLLAAVPAAAGAAGIAVGSFAALDLGSIKKAAEARQKLDAQLKAGLITQKSYNTALGKATVQLSAQEVKGLSVYDHLNDRISKVKASIQRELIPAIGDLGNALKANEKTIDGALIGGARIEAKGITNFSKYLGSGTGKGDLAALGRTSKIELAGAVQGTNMFLQALLSLNRTAEPMIAKLTGDFVGMTARFNAWVRTTAGRNSLEKFFQDTERSTVQLLQVLKNVAAIFHDIFSAGQGQSMGFLSFLDEGTNRLDNFLKSAQGQQKIGEVWTAVAKVANVFKDDLATLLPLLVRVATAVGEITKALHAMAGAFPHGQDIFPLLLAARLMGGAKVGSFVFGGSVGAYRGAAAAARAESGMATSLVGGAAMGGGQAAAGTAFSSWAHLGKSGEQAAQKAAGMAAGAETGAVEGAAMATVQKTAMSAIKPGLKAALTRVATRMGLLGALAVGGLLVYELSRASQGGGSAQTQALQGGLSGLQAESFQQQSQRVAEFQARANRPMAIADLSAQLDSNRLARSQLKDTLTGERAQLRSGFTGGKVGVGDRLTARAKQELRLQIRLDRHELDTLLHDGVDIKGRLRIVKAPNFPVPGHPDDDHHPTIPNIVPNSVQDIVNAGLNARPQQTIGRIENATLRGPMVKKFDLNNLERAAHDLDTIAAKAKGVDDNTMNAANAASTLIRELHRFPTKKEIEIEVQKEKALHDMDDIEAHRLQVPADVIPVTDQLTALEDRRLSIDATINVTNPGALSPHGRGPHSPPPAGSFSGGAITKPTAIVGEQAPRFKEWVIATNPAYRENNKRYLAQAAADMGGQVSFHEQGGILFGALPPTGYAKTEDPVPSKEKLLKALLTDTKGIAELTKLEASYKHMKDRNRREQLEVRKLREHASGMPSGDAKKKVNAQIQHLTTDHRKHLNEMSKTFEKIQTLKQKDLTNSSPFAARFGDAMTALHSAEQVALTTNDPKGWLKREQQELSLTEERYRTLNQMMHMTQFGKRMKRVPATARHALFDVLNEEMGTLMGSVQGLRATIKGGFSQAAGLGSSDDTSHNAQMLAELARLAREGLVLQDVSNAQFGQAVKYLQAQGSFAAGTPFVQRTGQYQLHYGEAVVPRSENHHYYGSQGSSKTELKITGEGPLTNMLAKMMTPMIEQKMGQNARVAKRMGLR